MARLERIEKVSEQNTIRLKAGDVLGTGDIVLQVQNLHMAYQEQELFEDLNFTIYKGEKVALIGGNGTGKSTILKIITGNTKPISGLISLEFPGKNRLLRSRA